MSKPTFSATIAVLMLAAAAIAWRGATAPDPTAWPDDREDLLRRAVPVPAAEHPVGSREPGCYPPARIPLPSFRIWPVETPRGWWRQYAGQAPGEDDTLPATSVSYDEAVAFCTWMSERFGVTVRLPTVDEWQAAARAGTAGVTYPWGWDLPDGRAVFDADGPQPVGRLAPNPWGLHDLAGNVAEWCRADDGATLAPAMGGSWAERDPRFLRISHRLTLPKPYRDADTGFRIVIEDPAGE